MATLIEMTGAEDIQRAENMGARAYHHGERYAPPRWMAVNPWLENAWRRGFVRAKHLTATQSPRAAA